MFSDGVRVQISLKISLQMLLDFLVLILLSCFLILFGTFVISFSNPIYSLLSLVCVFLLSACLLFQHGLDFLALSLVIVYVGAIAILFLFVIMMLDIKIQRQAEEFNQSFPVFLIFSLFFFSQLLFVYTKTFGNSLILSVSSSPNFFWDLTLDQTSTTIESLGSCLYTNFMMLLLLTGLLLLVAMVGAIVLTKKKISNDSTQDLSLQLNTSTIKYIR